MRAVLTKTGDPWMDWGLVNLGSYWEMKDWPIEWHHDQLLLDWPPEREDELADEMFRYMRDRMNRLIWQAPEMKILGIEHLQLDRQGFGNPKFSVKIPAKEREKLKQNLKNPNLKAEVTLARNYPGLKGDWLKLKKELASSVQAFWQQISGQTETRDSCWLCGRDMAESYDMRQNKNPLFNQHHNNRIRGYATSPEVGKMCPICNLLNIFSAVHANLPYAVGNSTLLYIPLANSLVVLKKVLNRLQAELIDSHSANVWSYRTNIKDLGYTVTRYQTLIGIYHTLVNRLQNEDESNLAAFPWEEAEKASLNGWVVVTYSKGKNVIMGTISYIRVPHRLFELVKPLTYAEGKKGTLLQWGINGINASTTYLLDEMARAIVQRNWSLFATSLFSIFKDNNSSVKHWSISFWESFISHSLEEVDKVLNKDLLEDIKVLGRVIGANFPEDIGLFTALNNAHDVGAFRRVLRDTFLKLHKFYVAQAKGSSRDKVLVPSESRVERILNELSEDNLDAVKDSLLIYATLQAMKKQEVEKNESN
ncbi:MAG: hypothetical protein H0Z35_13145 [Thermoanaerobacteraceae bacterium]|nr:hypothetical protein [Thermoanaerobacteraceae bacterium]